MKKKINEVTDYTLDPQIKEGIEIQYQNELKRRIKANKKQRRVDRILTIFIIGFIFVVVYFILSANSKMTNKAIEDCMSRGHSENYCYNKWA